MKIKLPLPWSILRGAVGKEIIIKQYKHGYVVCRYPRKSRFPATPPQQRNRELFKEAVTYAKAILSDPAQKNAWQKKLRRQNGVFNAAVQFFLKREKREREKASLETSWLLRKALDYGVPVKAIRYRPLPPGPANHLSPIKSTAMTDNKKNKGKQDRIRVDSRDPSEVEYLHRQFPGLTHQAITGAVRAAGPLRKDIVKYLGNKKASK